MDSTAQTIILGFTEAIKQSTDNLAFGDGAEDFEMMFEAIQNIRDASNSALETIREQFKHVDDAPVSTLTEM